MEFKTKIQDKTWSSILESEIAKNWSKDQIYEFKEQSSKEVFVIDTPPPYPSGRPWHIGAVAHYSQIDMIARTSRMMGYNVHFPIGIDRNGLPVEIYTEKKHKLKLHRTPRSEFIELCKNALDDLEQEMIEIMKNIGMSGNFKDYYRTDSENYRQLTQRTFIDLWKKGLIYEANRPNNYCKGCRTTIADAEVSYQEIPTKLVHVKFKVKEMDTYIEIATTRPELLFSCQLIIVNPDDDRYKKYHNMHVILPLFSREVKIMPHSSAKPEFGTGAVMICSYGDYTDLLLFRELGLEEILSIDTEGKMSNAAGKYAKLKVEEARANIIQDLESKQLLVKQEVIMHRTPICERSRTPLEIIPMKEFYLKQMDYIPIMRKLANELIFHPEEHRQILLNWIDAIKYDWPISRRRYYATEIPIWYCKSCRTPAIPKPGKYYRPWIDPAPFDKCEKCGEKEFEGDTRTFDTWMDSSISPLFISNYGVTERLFNKTYPNSIRPQGKDIIRTWLYYTILRCHYLTNKSPFNHVWIMGYGVDAKGERMSKSKGNVIDPQPILNRYGADTFRLWSASESSLGSDFRCSDSKINGIQKSMTKLWNISRFVSSFPQPNNAELNPTDEWILAELSKLVEECLTGYRNYNFFIPSNKIREFTWNIFAAHYIEMAKGRAYDFNNKIKQEAAWYTLHQCLQTILQLQAPITPFMTDYIWTKLYSNTSIHLELFPKNIWKNTGVKKTSELIEFNSKIWNIKKTSGKSLRDPIDIAIPLSLDPFKKDLQKMHNIS